MIKPLTSILFLAGCLFYLPAYSSTHCLCSINKTKTLSSGDNYQVNLVSTTFGEKEYFFKVQKDQNFIYFHHQDKTYTLDLQQDVILLENQPLGKAYNVAEGIQVILSKHLESKTCPVIAIVHQRNYPDMQPLLPSDY